MRHIRLCASPQKQGHGLCSAKNHKGVRVGDTVNHAVMTVDVSGTQWWGDDMTLLTLAEGACEYFSFKYIDQFVFGRGILGFVCYGSEFSGEVYTSSICGITGHRIHSVKANSADQVTELPWDLLKQPVAHRMLALSLFHHFLLVLEGSQEK